MHYLFFLRKDNYEWFDIVKKNLNEKEIEKKKRKKFEKKKKPLKILIALSLKKIRKEMILWNALFEEV